MSPHLKSEVFDHVHSQARTGTLNSLLRFIQIQTIHKIFTQAQMVYQEKAIERSSKTSVTCIIIWAKIKFH